MLTGGAFYTRDGYKPIKEIQKGDKVYSRNEKTGEICLKKVEEVFCTTAYTVYHVWIDGNEEFKITAYHPVYVHEQGWITAINLREGDVIETIDGCAYITKIGKIRYEESVPVYNFHVKDWLSYFVGLTRIYIHNTDSEHDKKIWKAISRKIEAEGMDVSDWNKGTFDSVYPLFAKGFPKIFSVRYHITLGFLSSLFPEVRQKLSISPQPLIYLLKYEVCNHKTILWSFYLSV